MRIDEPESVRVVHAAIDAGITFFDTADIYGSTNSEVYLGHALAGRRDNVVIATKFGMRVDAARRTYSGLAPCRSASTRMPNFVAMTRVASPGQRRPRKTSLFVAP